MLVRIWGLVIRYSLRLVDGLGHGEEGAVGQDSQHHKVVKILVHGNVDSSLPQLKFRNQVISGSSSLSTFS